MKSRFRRIFRKVLFMAASDYTTGVVTASALGIWLLFPFGELSFGIEPPWAFDFLHYVAWYFRLLMAGVVVALVLPAVQRGAFRILERMRRPPLWIVILLSSVLFWSLRERTFYGDGLRKVGLLSVTELQTDLYTWKEPLDTLLVFVVTRLFAQVDLSAEHAIAALSVVAGIVYVITVFYLSSLLIQGRSRRVLFGVGLLALGSSQLWFGHVENYSLVTAATYVTVLLALAHRHGRVPLWTVGLASGTAVSFHPQAAFTLPALFLLLRRDQWPRQLGVLAMSALVVPLLTAATLLLMGTALPAFDGTYAGDPQLFWKLEEALHPRQLLQALINLWLLVPALPVLVPAALIGGRWSLRQDWTVRYLVALATGLLLYHFFFQNDLPRFQDWDLYAIVGPGVMLLLLYALLSEETGRTPMRLAARFADRRVLLPSLAFSLCFTAAWVGVNHGYRLVRPDPDLRPFYTYYRVVDLLDLLPAANVTPVDPICLDPDRDPTGCRRVAITMFTMPQDGDERAVLFAHAPAQITFPVQVPREQSFLWTSVALDPLSWGWGGDGVTFQIRIVHGGKEDLRWEQHLSPDNSADLDWQEVMVPLDTYRGQDVQVRLVTSPGPDDDASSDRAGWGFPWILRGTVDRRERP